MKFLASLPLALFALSSFTFAVPTNGTTLANRQEDPGEVIEVIKDIKDFIEEIVNAFKSLSEKEKQDKIVSLRLLSIAL